MFIPKNDIVSPEMIAWVKMLKTFIVTFAVANSES